MTTEALRQAYDFVDLLALTSFVLSCDKDGTIRFEHLNTAYSRIVGPPTESVRGKTPHECFPARVADTLTKNYETCRASGRPYDYTAPIPKPENSHGR